MTAPFPPFDFGRYVWRASPDDASHWKREAGGGEYIDDVFHTKNHGEQFLFLALKATLSKPVPTTELVARARDAWSALRFSTPTVAAHTEHDAAGTSLITYRTAKDATEVHDWAARTVRLVEGTPDLDDLRFELGKLMIPEQSGDQTFLYIVARSDTSYDFLLRTSHVTFDGAGIKIVLTLVLTKLALYLSDPALVAKEKFEWGAEAKNLLPCISEILGPTEKREGETYTRCLSNMLGDLGGAMPRQYGFKVRNIGPGPTRRISYKFSAEESKKLLDAVRGRGFTFNHVAHAAVTLVCALDNPPSASTPPDATFVYYGLVDGRARLAEPYSGKLGYPGYALGMTAIQVPVSAAVPAAGEGERDVLLRLSGIVKDEYAKQRAYESLMAIVCQEVDIMLGGMKAGGPPPPPWMGPWYAGDGVGETGLQPEYGDARGANVITVDDFFVSLNKTDPGPFFRSFSWRGRITVSADANVSAMPQGDVEKWVEKWAELLRLVL
ncbi:hypothetical protein SCP_0503710 [Sparassis crispa]|uniref:Uncharacterized protein n=1 Tax=Sparassis crispa TaxID=139825 RepID=A0A401GM75_9APHY|nr:hypothetical protein SCP_0503710 [Sparassis crispa]GBE83323.1 hypothetical protein SCP_0503710 [Sparassis crispa]